MKIFETTARVLENREVMPGYFTMTLSCDDIAKAAQPGQFVMVRTGLSNHPLLRRPFSVHDVFKGNHGKKFLSILYNVVGHGTKKMSLCLAGDALQVLGPLGKGFLPDSDAKQNILVAGGIGIAPLVFFARRLAKDFSPQSCSVILGAKTKNDILCLEFLEEMGVSVQIATENGSLGKKGLVTDLLEDEIRKAAGLRISACGPMPMLKAVAKMARLAQIPCQVSIESIMACGMGACLGCAVPKIGDQNKYFHACTDGPVFDASRLWE